MFERGLLPDESESVAIARWAIRVSKGKSLRKLEVVVISRIPPDGPELLGYLMDRHEAGREGQLGNFILSHSANGTDGHKTVPLAEAQKEDKRLE